MQKLIVAYLAMGTYASARRLCNYSAKHPFAHMNLTLVELGLLKLARQQVMEGR